MTAVCSVGYLTSADDRPLIGERLHQFDVRSGDQPAKVPCEASPHWRLIVTAIAKSIGSKKPFLTDVKTLRDRARANITDGNVTFTYGGDVEKTIEILQSVLATEIVCVLRYTMHSIAANGISSEGVKAEFAEHAREEQEHMMAVGERINQLGGTPNFNPEGLLSRSASEYSEGENLVDMIKENLIAERIAVDHYRELVRYFGDDDPGTRVMLEGILRVEEEHVDDMHDLLVAHEGKPMLPA
jgi:bacterioferritin